MQYDLIIIGAGPAGAAAAVYAARKKHKTLLITESFGGQSVVSAGIENWIGDINISGIDLAKKLENHVKTYKEIEIRENDLAESVVKKDDGFIVKTKKGESYDAISVFLAVGSRRRKLGVPGEEEFNAKGVFYCSICDAPMMKGMDAAVVGGGNTALEAVVDLIPYAKKIYLIHRRDEFRGDPVTIEKVKKEEKVEIITPAEIVNIEGKVMVEGITYKHKDEEKKLKLSGVFVEIGSLPNSELAKDLVELNKGGEIMVNHQTQQTSCPGIWAAGDVTDVRFKQNNVSAGDGVKAALDIHEYLSKQ